MVGAAAAAHRFDLILGDLFGSIATRAGDLPTGRETFEVDACVETDGPAARAEDGRTGEGNNDRLMPGEKSDSSVVAGKPGKPGGAKGGLG